MPAEKKQSFCPCSRALNRSSKGLNMWGCLKFTYYKCQTRLLETRPHGAKPKVHCSRVKKSKRQNTARLKLTDTIISVTCPSFSCLKMRNVSEASCVFIFRQRSTYPGWPPRLSYSQSYGTTQTITCYNIIFSSKLCQLPPKSFFCILYIKKI
jgi:hypothetical protein